TSGWLGSRGEEIGGCLTAVTSHKDALNIQKSGVWVFSFSGSGVGVILVRKNGSETSGTGTQSMNSVVKLEHKDVDAIPFQDASLDIWDKKYRLSAKDGTPVDKTMDDTYKRVARALADVEPESVREHWN